MAGSLISFLILGVVLVVVFRFFWPDPYDRFIHTVFLGALVGMVLWAFVHLVTLVRLVAPL